jgi:hypothetical protein
VEVVDDGLAAIRRTIPDDLAAAEFDHPVGGTRDLPIVSHDEHGPVLGGARREKLKDLNAGLEVEFAGRLVGEQDGVACRKRSGDGDALLFSAGKLVREVMSARAPSPTFSSTSAAEEPFPRLPRTSIANCTFSCAVKVGNRLNVWKMNPIVSRRNLNFSAVVARVTSWSLTTIRPLVGASSALIILRSVDLPLPDGPRMTTNSPVPTSRLALSSAVTLAAPIS